MLNSIQKERDYIKRENLWIERVNYPRPKIGKKDARETPEGRLVRASPGKGKFVQ